MTYLCATKNKTNMNRKPYIKKKFALKMETTVPHWVKIAAITAFILGISVIVRLLKPAVGT